MNLIAALATVLEREFKRGAYTTEAIVVAVNETSRPAREVSLPDLQKALAACPAHAPLTYKRLR